MGVEDLGTGTRSVGDSIGSEPTINPINKIKVDGMKLEDAAIIVKTRSIGHGWIAGSSTNAIVGTWTGTADGEQLTVGDSSFDVATYISNPNNLFIDRFNNSYFRDTVNSTATNHTGYVSFTSGQAYQSNQINTDLTVSTVTLNSDYTGTLTFQIQCDGSHWETLVPGEQKILTYPGTAPKIKVTESGATTATLINMRVQLNS